MTTLFTAASPVRDIAILLLPGFSNLGLATAVEPLRAANQLAGERLYHWRLVSADGAGVTTSSDLEISVSGRFDGREEADALLVVAGAQYAARASRPLVAGVRRAAGHCRCLGGLDTGSHLLAAAGLLDGRRATIHWEEIETFAEAFPAVEVVRDRYVIDGNRITAGGATTVLDLMLDIVARQDGMALALAVAGRFIYDPAARPGEPQRAVPTRLVARKDEAVAAAIGLMETHLEDPLPVDGIARLTGIGLRDLERRFARHVGLSPGAYYRSLRLALARRLLEETDLPIGEVAARSGFSSAAVLTRALRRETGRPARAHRRRTR